MAKKTSARRRRAQRGGSRTRRPVRRTRAAASEQAVRPKKIVPGIQGRSEWFAERTGRLPGSDSIGRLKAALGEVSRMREAQAPDAVVDQAHDLLRRARLPRAAENSALMIAPNGRVTVLRPVQARRKEGLSAASRAFDVPYSKTPWSMLILPVDPKLTSYLDLDEVVGSVAAR